MAVKSKAELYFEKPGPFQDVVIILRNAILSTSPNLEETVKWGRPVYTYEGKNIVGIAAFKQHAALWFFQGALLSDPAKVLVNAQEGKTKAMLQWRFHAIGEIEKCMVKQYVAEAIKNQIQGLVVKPDRAKQPIEIPELLGRAIVKDNELKRSFFELTRGRRKDYCEYIASAKKEETKQKRLKKIVPMIKAGVGLNDKYRQV